MSIGKVLVADDDPPIRILLQKELSKQGYSVDVVENGTQALDKLREGTFNVALIDIVMPEMDGVNVLKQIAKEDINTNVIMLTGNSSIDMAVECMKLGAFQYIRKPFSRDDLLVHLERAFEFQRSKRSLKILENELEKTGYRQQLIGKSKPMVELKRMIVRVANTNSTVLILGESGTGKELVSRMIHDQSPNSGNPFVTVN
ncbi:MAG: sigma-54-dependent transcriptional regulator, partial [Chitinivibrionales bacterium]